MKPLFIIFISLFFSNNSIAQTKPQVLVTYYSETYNTKALAEAVAKGVKSVKGVDLTLKTIEETTEQDLINADAIIVGSPVYNANPAPEVLSFIKKWPFRNQVLKNKIGAVFVTGGGISSGEELVQTSLIHSMLIFGMVIIGGNDWQSAFGASAITNEEPFKEPVQQIFLLKGEALGKRIAETVLRWNK
jgi:NAD(P)H dehydrogenase (quinone)